MIEPSERLRELWTRLNLLNQEFPDYRFVKFGPGASNGDVVSIASAFIGRDTRMLLSEARGGKFYMLFGDNVFEGKRALAAITDDLIRLVNIFARERGSKATLFPSPRGEQAPFLVASVMLNLARLLINPGRLSGIAESLAARNLKGPPEQLAMDVHALPQVVEGYAELEGNIVRFPGGEVTLRFRDESEWEDVLRVVAAKTVRLSYTPSPVFEYTRDVIYGMLHTQNVLAYLLEVHEKSAPEVAPTVVRISYGDGEKLVGIDKGTINRHAVANAFGDSAGIHDIPKLKRWAKQHKGGASQQVDVRSRKKSVKGAKTLWWKCENPACNWEGPDEKAGGGSCPNCARSLTPVGSKK